MYSREDFDRDQELVESLLEYLEAWVAENPDDPDDSPPETAAAVA